MKSKDLEEEIDIYMLNKQIGYMIADCRETLMTGGVEISLNLKWNLDNFTKAAEHYNKYLNDSNLLKQRRQLVNRISIEIANVIEVITPYCKFQHVIKTSLYLFIFSFFIMFAEPR